MIDDTPPVRAPRIPTHQHIPVGEKAIEAAILSLVLARGADKTICPSEVARALSTQPGAADWRSKNTAVRRAAIRLAADGQIDILRKGRRVDPIDVKGVIRLGLPKSDAS